MIIVAKCKTAIQKYSNLWWPHMDTESQFPNPFETNGIRWNLKYNTDWVHV